MEDDEIDLMALLETLRRQTGLIIATIVLCLAGAAVYLFSVTPMYTASTLVLVDPSQKDLLDPGSQGNLNLAFANSLIESEVEILRSDGVALKVVGEEGLVSDPEFGTSVGLMEKLTTALGIRRDKTDDPRAIVRNVVNSYKKAIEVRRKGQTFLISVSVSSASPERASELANAHSQSYIEQQVEAKIRSTLAARDTLQRQIATSRGDLALSELAFDAFIETNVSRIEAETGRTDIASLSGVLAGLEASRLRSEVTLSQSQTEFSNRNWSVLAAQLESEVLSELERERAGIERRLGLVVEGSQSSIDLRAEITALEERLEQRSAQELSTLRQNVSSLTVQEEDTRRNLRETLIAGQLPPDLLAEIFEIQQDASNARAQYQNLLARTRDLETQAGVQIADSRVVSPALIPTRPSFPNKKLVAALALVLGAGLGVFFAFLREFFIGGFTSAAQLQDAVHAPVASIVPLADDLTKEEISPADKIINEPLSSYSEAIRRLRAAVDQKLHPINGIKDKTAAKTPVILVTSAVPNEGKSTTALALARTYAIAGKRVLLIDADLRKPSLHVFIDAEPSSGFLDYLRSPQEHVSMKEFSNGDPMSDLTLVLGRARSAIPTDQLISSVRFEKVLAGARQTFDVVILDSPPLLPVVDAHYLAKYADLTIMVVRWASTKQSDIRSIRGSLRDAMQPDAPIISILSHHEGRRGRGYYDYYGYGSDREG
ncbi:MAG: GumC family protein [Marinosulfonomonas sp.]